MMLFPISAAIIGVSAAVDVPLQHANAVSIDDDDGTTSSCRHHVSDTSKKCSKNDTLDSSFSLKLLPPNFSTNVNICCPEFGEPLTSIWLI
jgi:hypothetical protein